MSNLLLRNTLLGSSATFYSNLSTEELCGKIKFICSEKNILAGPNLSGWIDANHLFEITHKIEPFVISGVEMNATLKGQILDTESGSKIQLVVKPNSFYYLAFSGFFIGGLIYTVLALFDNSSLSVGLLCLFVACPVLMLIAYHVKKALVKTFVTTFMLSKEIPHKEPSS